MTILYGDFAVLQRVKHEMEESYCYLQHPGVAGSTSPSEGSPPRSFPGGGCGRAGGEWCVVRGAWREAGGVIDTNRVTSYRRAS